MDCPANTPESKEAFLPHFMRKVHAQRIPLSGSINLTNRCNVRCVHCYIRPPAGHDEAPQELPTQRWLEILDEITEAGCLFFLITGGEPLLRPDFPEIYKKARRNGLVVTLFTNGTLIDDAMLDLFGEYPPYEVEITLYGATAATYERITQSPGSYRKCMTAITRLQERGVPLALKSVLMAPNVAEFGAIRRLAQELGCKFRMDASLVPHVNGDKAPLGLRVSPERAVEIEFEQPERAAAWRRYYERHEDYQHSETAYACSAGITEFHIDAFGHLQICLMETRWWHDLKTGSFREGWLDVLPRIFNRPAPPNDPCRQCPEWLFCGCCKPQIAMETGSDTVPPPFLCDVGKARRRKIESSLSGVDANAK
jgi:MoaA/NifB/PqqE/SkfB family radical SAM enzyme